MIKKEQLGNQQELRLDFLQRFEEGEINFSPTYKIGITWVILRSRQERVQSRKDSRLD